MATNCFGLLTKQKLPVPLKDISVGVHVKGILADVTATLLYKNELQDPVEATFFFPLDDDAAVYNFEAVIDGKTVIAEIKEKQIARDVYDDTISSGQQAFLLEEEESGDVFSCIVGNLPPGQEAAVCISYVTQLSIEVDQAARFILPVVLNPRYTPADSPSSSVTANIPRLAADDLPYRLHLSLQVQGLKEIQSIRSNCELTDITYNNDLKTSAQISLKEEHTFDRDVEILIYYLDPCSPYALVERGKQTSTEGTLMGDPMVMMILYPEVGDGVTEPGQEFIFVVDQSGSMSECVTRNSSQTRIQTAKDTLVLLLKSLRLGCLFNIYGFGSSFTSFFKSSVTYDQKSMESALKKLETFGADLGGTEILSPLQDIFAKSLKKGYQRQVFLLTDGEVGNTTEIISAVKEHSNTHRFFSLGIGEGASTSLIKGVAAASNGKYEFITGKDRMQAKVLKCLKLAYQPSTTNISLQWKLPTGVEALVLPRIPEVIFHQQRTVIYVQLKGLENSNMGECQALLKYFCGPKEYHCSLNFSLKPEETESLSIHYMAAKAVIKDQGGYSDTLPPRDEIDRLTKVSIESNVISPYTAYTAVYKDDKQPVQGPLIQQNVPLPASLHGSLLRDMQLGCSLSAGVGPRKLKKSGFPFKFPSFGFGSASRRFKEKSSPLQGTQGCEFSPKRYMDQKLQSADLAKESSLLVEEKAWGPDGLPGQSTKKTDPVMNLITLQKADGSWVLDKDLAEIFNSTKEEILNSMPLKEADPTVWATLLSLIWLHSHGAKVKDDWELLAFKSISWLKSNATGIDFKKWINAGNRILKTKVDPHTMGL